MMRAPVKECGGCELGAGGNCPFARRKVAADTVVVAQGASPTELAFVRSGLVALTTVSAEGDQTWRAIRGPRSLLAPETIDGAPSRCEVRTLTDSELCSAPAASVKAMLKSERGAQGLFALLVTELSEQRRDVDLRTGKVQARVARFALAFDALIGNSAGRPTLSKAQVATLLGMRPETLSRVLGRLAGRGLIDVSHGMKVLNRAALEAVAQS